MAIEKLTKLRVLGCLAAWKNSILSVSILWTDSDQQAYHQLKEMIQKKPVVTMTEIENAVGDTSDEYTEGVVELFESKGFMVEK